jgi:ABC-type transport system involved in multi-copper enzyme maturation permease subunit
MKVLRRLLDENPVLRYHLLGQTRHRMRNQTAISVVVIVLAALCYGFLLLQVLQYGIDVQSLAFFLLFLVCLLIPAASHALLSAEYERNTWESLVLTRLPVVQIVMGKWLSRFLMIVILMGLFGFVFMVGSWHESQLDYGTSVLRMMWIIMTWGCLLLSFCLWISNRTRNSLSAAALSFGGQFFFLLVVPMLLFATLGSSELNPQSDSLFGQTGTGNPNDYTPIPGWFLGWRMLYWLNPFVVLAEAAPNYFNSSNYIRILPGWGVIQGFYYVLGSVLLIWLTVRNLRGKNRKK